MTFTNKNNEDLSDYTMLDFFDSQGRYLGEDAYGVGISDLDDDYLFRWDDGITDEAADKIKKDAIASAPAPEYDWDMRWTTGTDEDGVFLVLI